MPIPVQKDAKLLLAEAIDKDQIQELCDKYHKCTKKRKDPGGSSSDHNKDHDTKCAWFSVQEILDLLKENKVTLNDPKLYGIRIYFGFHHPRNSFQPKPDPPYTKEDYHYHDTPILVVTKQNANNEDQDCLTPGNAFVSVAGLGKDNSKLCPPECRGVSIQ